MLYKTIRSRLLPIHSTPLFLSYSLSIVYKARFKRRATAVPNSIDRIKFDLSIPVDACRKFPIKPL